MAQLVRRRRSRRPVPKPAKAKRAAASKISGIERFRKLLETGNPAAHDHVLLLGLKMVDSLQLLRAVEQGLPYGAFERFTINSSLATEDALALVNIPRRTLTRRKREGRFHRDESDRLVRASRILARAIGLFEGDTDAAKHWLSEPQKALGGEVPLTLARTEVGALEVERLIGRLEHGVFP